MAASDNDRIAYLAGEQVPSLDVAERAELDELRGVLAAPATWVEPAPRLEDNIVAAIAAEAARATATAEPDTTAEPAGPAEPDTTAATRAPKRPRTSRWHLPKLTWPRLGVALAGAAAVAAVAIVIASSGTSSPKPLQFAMVVTGTPLAPHAHGSATLTKTASGWEIQLSATGLPHLENGLYYQAWLKNPAGIVVPVGTFNDARRVILWSGVPVTKGFDTLTVTRQLANGNPASSGQRVLVGKVTGQK